MSRRTVPWGGEVRLGGRVSGAGVSGMTVRLEQQRFPFDQGFTQLSTARTGSDGGYLFTIASLYATTRYRVSTSTQVVVTSPVATRAQRASRSAPAPATTRASGRRSRARSCPA